MHRFNEKMVSRRPKTNIIFFAITVSILCIIMFVLHYSWRSLLRKARTSPFDSAAMATHLSRLQSFRYKELKNATNRFSESNIIGKGGSGTVYRGVLKDGKLVAVKYLDLDSLQCDHEFQNEVKILGGLRCSSLIVCLLGFCVERGKKFVVYEYMPNKSLQDCLFNINDKLCLSWARRFTIILDVAKALEFLHLECDPAVVHGDVKPSNVLLDSEFRAKLSDFGLSRVKLEDQPEVDMFSQELGKSRELGKSGEISGSLSAGGVEIGCDQNEISAYVPHKNDGPEFVMALQASSSMRNRCGIDPSHTRLAANSSNFRSHGIRRGNIKGKGVLTKEHGGEDLDMIMPCDCEMNSKDHSKELSSNNSMAGHGHDHVKDRDHAGAKQWGKYWWWRRDESGELCRKDYVNEWIGSQACSSSTNPNWDEEMGHSKQEASPADSTMKQRVKEVVENPVTEHGVKSTNAATVKDELKRLGVCDQPAHAKKHRKMLEWWEQEQEDELRKKSFSAKMVHLCKTSKWSKPHFGLGKRFHLRWTRFRCVNLKSDRVEGELSFRNRSKKATHSLKSSQDLLSRELSSTTSLRGTLCYVAPEYSASYRHLMEKGDIYSLGVLILVIVSGRRPLHVNSSTMKIEKANLISWSRVLARSGNVLELVDEKLEDEYDKDQVSLCIHLALSCLQKAPELRPDIGDIVKTLNGEMELSSPPFEFTPSPSSRGKHTCSEAN